MFLAAGFFGARDQYIGAMSHPGSIASWQTGDQCGYGSTSLDLCLLSLGVDWSHTITWLLNFHNFPRLCWTLISLFLGNSSLTPSKGSPARRGPKTFHHVLQPRRGCRKKIRWIGLVWTWWTRRQERSNGAIQRRWIWLIWLDMMNGIALSCGRERYDQDPNGINVNSHSTNYWLVVWNINFIFPYIGNNHPNWLIFFRGVETTNQTRFPCV